MLVNQRTIFVLVNEELWHPWLSQVRYSTNIIYHVPSSLNFETPYVLTPMILFLCAFSILYSSAELKIHELLTRTRTSLRYLLGPFFQQRYSKSTSTKFSRTHAQMSKRSWSDTFVEYHSWFWYIFGWFVSQSHGNFLAFFCKKRFYFGSWLAHEFHLTQPLTHLTTNLLTLIQLITCNC